MTPAEADQRIILSRKTLHRYVAMMDAGVVPVGDATLIANEIELLSAIAGAFPDKGMKLVNLVAQWVKVQDRLRAKMN